jgi:hypothetical protein
MPLSARRGEKNATSFGDLYSPAPFSRREKGEKPDLTRLSATLSHGERVNTLQSLYFRCSLQGNAFYICLCK